MTKSNIISIVIVFIGLAGLIAWGSTQEKNSNLQNASNQDQPAVLKSEGSVRALEMPEKMFDFGKISMKNGNVEHLYRVTNPTDKDIFIKKLTTSCMCTKAYLIDEKGERGPFGMEGMGFVPPANYTLSAGQSIDIKAVFDPNAHGPAGVGFISRAIVLSGEDGDQATFEFKAIVTP